MKRILCTLVLTAIFLHFNYTLLKADNVLPGDCNQNGQVELVDFLFWGLAAGNTGDKRLNATTDCTKESAVDWKIEINGINGKHQDADGNGLVDANDLKIIRGNYGCNSGNANSPMLNRENAAFNIVEQTTIVNGETAHIFELYIKDIDEINGLAFSFDYSSMAYGIKEDAIKVDTAGTWLQTSEMVVLQDVNQDKMDIAFTGSIPVQPPQNQPACKIIIIEDFIGAKPLSLNINIVNGVSLNSTGKATNFQNASYIKDGITSYIDYTMADSYTVFPAHVNSSDQLSVHFINPLADHTGHLTVHSISGKLIMTNNIQLQPDKNTMQINTNNFVQGIYVVSLSSAKLPHYSEKIIVRK